MVSSSDKLMVWPFLIGRNQTLDYRPILVPDFLKENSAIIQRAAKLNHHSSSIKLLEVYDGKLGTLVFIYHSIKAMRDGEVLLDGYSREIFRIEGFVFKKNHLDQEEIDEILDNDKLFSAAKLEIDKAFDSFWKQTTPDKASLSEPIPSDIRVTELDPVGPPKLPVIDTNNGGNNDSNRFRLPIDRFRSLIINRLVIVFNFIPIMVVLVSIMVLWFMVDSKIKLVGAETVTIDDQDLNYAFETFFEKEESDEISQTLKSSWIISLNPCAEIQCRYAMIVFPFNLNSTQSLKPINISNTAEVIHDQLVISENLKNCIANSEDVEMSYHGVESSRNIFKDMNILYAVVHKFDQEESGLKGKWRLEIHDIRGKKKFGEDSETIALGEVDIVRQSLISASTKLASRLQFNFSCNLNGT